MLHTAALAVCVTLAKPVVGYVQSSSGTAVVVRDSLTLRLGESSAWLPICLDDTVDATKGKIVAAFGRSNPQHVEFQIRQKLDENFFKGLALEDTETTYAKPLIRKGGEVDPGTAILMLADAAPTFVTGYATGATPSIHWVSGKKVKKVSFKLLDENDEVIWPSDGEPASFDASLGAAQLSSMYRKVAALAEPQRDVPAKLKLVIDGASSRIYRLRIQNASRQAVFATNRLFLVEPRSPWNIVNLWNGPDGYNKYRLNAEAVEVWFRAHKKQPKSQTILIQGALLADAMDSQALSIFVDGAIDDAFVKKWVSEPAVLGALWYPARRSK